MLWGGRWEGGSCLGMHVRIKNFKIKKKKEKKAVIILEVIPSHFTIGFIVKLQPLSPNSVN